MSSTISPAEPTPNAWNIALPNAATHIRLLKLTSTQEDGDVRCTISAHNLSEAPSYAAISYTWGAPDLTRCISINSQKVLVRENCFCALWQAQHQREAYIWIDAICVDQENLGEKSFQVAMMGMIYERATHVLIALGPYTAESRFLVNHIPVYKSALEPPGDWKLAFQQMEDRLGSDHLLQLANALVWFATRPYWTRVWVIQEYVVAQHIIVICGEDILDLEAIIDWHMNLPQRHLFHDAAAELGQKLEQDLASFSRDHLLEDSPITSLKDKRTDWFSGSRRFRRDENTAESDLRSILDFRGNDCLNPLDRIYGFLHLTSELKNVIVPDYRISNFDLAMQCLDNLRNDTLTCARGLLGALNLDSRQPEVRAILEARRDRYQDVRSQSPRSNHGSVHFNNDSPSTAPDLAAEKPAYHTSFSRKYRFDGFVEVEFLKLEEDDNECLTGTLIAHYDSFRNDSETYKAILKRSHELTNFCTSRQLCSDNVQQPTELYIDDMVVGLLCNRAQQGDYILRSEDEVVAFGTYKFRICLLVRQWQNTKFEVIGQALISIDWAFCPGGTECSCKSPNLHTPPRQWYGIPKPRITSFDLYLARDDVVAFAAHDLIGERIETEIREGRVVDLCLVPRDPLAPLQRLSTNIISERCSSYAISRLKPNVRATTGIEESRQRSSDLSDATSRVATMIM